MKIIVDIGGREAIPVRAIPFATNWDSMGPDELADAFAQADEHSFGYRGLKTYWIEEGEVHTFRPIWWENFACRSLAALHERLKSEEEAGVITHEEGYQRWRQESIRLLPPGSFVWRDEFEPRYLVRHGSEGESLLVAAADGEEPEWMSPDVQDARVLLDLNPFLASPELRSVVMEGFESRATTSNPMREIVESLDDGPEVLHLPDLARPEPLTTGDIAFCFNGLRWNETGWKKPLGDKPKWLRACVVVPARRGLSETRWDPVLIGAALIRGGDTQARSVRAKFQTKAALAPWLDTWKSYEAEYFDSD